MTDPIDPNAYPEYQPPPPFAPPAPEQWQPQPQPQPQPYGGPVPYGWPPPPPPPSSHLRRNVIVVAAAVTLVAAAVIGYLAIGNGSSTPDRLAIPPSFHGYVQVHDASADQVESVIRGMASGVGGGTQQTFDAATIGVYENHADVTSRLIVFALRSSALPDGAGSADAFGRSLLIFMGPTVHEVPPGPHRGTESCGTTTVGAANESACSWSDRATCGLLLSVNAANHPLPVRRLSRLVQGLRDEID